jgi:hypothetical protein
MPGTPQSTRYRFSATSLWKILPKIHTGCFNAHGVTLFFVLISFFSIPHPASSSSSLFSTSACLSTGQRAQLNVFKCLLHDSLDTPEVWHTHPIIDGAANGRPAEPCTLNVSGPQAESYIHQSRLKRANRIQGVL